MKDKWAEHFALVELWIGIGICCIPAFFVVMLLPGERSGRVLGILIGAICAIAAVAHMEYVINKALYQTEKGAKATAWSGYMIRYFVAAVVLAAVSLTGIADPICCFIGMMFIKFAAYLQPLTHRISEAVCGKEVFYREMVPEEEQFPEEFKREAEEAERATLNTETTGE